MGSQTGGTEPRSKRIRSSRDFRILSAPNVKIRGLALRPLRISAQRNARIGQAAATRRGHITKDEAISRHRGQADTVRQKFNALTATQKRQLMRFLESL